MADDPSSDDDDQEWFAARDMELIPSSMSRERAALLPPTPSEDARHVLGTIVVPALEEDEDDDRDYLPQPAVSWVVDTQVEGDPPLDPQKVSERFYQDRYAKLGRFVIFGRDVDTGRWTYLISADGPRAVDRLKFSFDYIDAVDVEAPPPDRTVYEERLSALTEGVQELGDATTSASLPPAEAAERSRLLVEVRSQLDMIALLRLEAPEGQPYDAKQVWDVMLCLGLEWGDMDCFHWLNASGVGDDSFFSVETTTPPGYFLPEDIAEGGVELDDLLFVYSVPRNARPVETFDAMLRAVEYCRNRLGGTIVDEEGDPVDAAALRDAIGQIADRLRSAGFEPGADATLQLF
ncbi:MAG TPA: cell division protein ZipA C-terminal FtsZ-binding domain-containing protein [Pirellulaceae bacterium]|jgi:cell division protein ZipA|nr:cell division protein ZipA C-terminal FtsZ-binding domain-containing protein [Pirellulaceae bacterium]